MCGTTIPEVGGYFAARADTNHSIKRDVCCISDVGINRAGQDHIITGANLVCWKAEAPMEKVL